MVAAAAVARPAPTWADTFSNAAGSPYAIARQSCARQGKVAELYSDQTSDQDTAVSVTVKYRCVARTKGVAKHTTMPSKRKPHRSASSSR